MSPTQVKDCQAQVAEDAGMIADGTKALTRDVRGAEDAVLVGVQEDVRRPG